MRQVSAIFWITLTETARQPVYALIMTCSFLFIAILPAFAAHIYTFGAGSGLEHAANRMIADLGLSTVLLAGLVLSVFASSSVISREIENKTALTILSKRVSRANLVLGKYLGVAAAIALSVATSIISVMLIVRSGPTVAASEAMDLGVLGAMAAIGVLSCFYATFRNYYRGRAWVGAYTFAFVLLSVGAFLGFALFDTEYRFIFLIDKATTWTTYDWDVFRAGLLTLMAVLVLSAVSVAASTRLGTGGNFAVSAVVFLGGLTSDFFLNRFGTLPCKALHALMPNLQTFWMSEALTREKPIPDAYLAYAGGYAGCYIAAMLFVASFLFQKRDVS